MGRHSGYLGSAITLALTAAAISRIIADVGGSADRNDSLPNESHRDNAAMRCRLATPSAGTQFQTRPEGVGETTGFEQTPAQSVLHVAMPAGALLVIGSLDITGAPHKIRITSREELSPGTPVTRDACEPATALMIRNALPAQNDETSIAIRKMSIPRLQSVSSDVVPLNARRASAVLSAAYEGSTPNSRTARPALQRSFLVPHFEPTAVLHEPALATLIATSGRVAVFLDNGLTGSGLTRSDRQANAISSVNTNETLASAHLVCQTLESRLLDTVCSWIHSIVDLDDDGHLTIVMTDLDRQDHQSVTPVLGCVRDEDFQQYPCGDFGGDIIYLDYRLPAGDELTALLAHELTHAAVACLHLESGAVQPPVIRSRVQPWLNEAAAHWVELCFCSEPAGFSSRVRHFQSDTSACPIVACQSYLPLATRRAGSRVSGVSFLRRFIEHPEQLRKLLHDERPLDQAISSITGQPFAELFRTWSAEQAQSVLAAMNPHVKCVARNGTLTSRIHGTSFILVRSAETSCEFVIETDQAASLQLTVLSDE